MTNRDLLISHISKLSEDEISPLLDAVTIMLRNKELAPKPACLHCAAQPPRIADYPWNSYITAADYRSPPCRLVQACKPYMNLRNKGAKTRY